MQNSAETPGIGRVSPTDATATAVGGPGTAPRPTLGLSGPPRIGRYVFLEQIGEGGMGIVVAGYDPKLDRKVAIKLIHDVRRDDTERRIRMEREAQAMARLSHPNVVTVYEVGDFNDQLFVAMEFITGQDLSAWLRSREHRDWRTVLDMFIQAGRGLAAAHRAGIVHRDFKPGNVFVGDDGRARVGDFGLARRGSDDDQGLAETQKMRVRARVDSEGTALDNKLTSTGAMMGTPAYMAPEQFLARPTDTRTDQFSFCAAAWEAFYGQRPFRGETFAELMTAVTEGTRQPAPARSRVPAWVRRVLERGLAVEPAERYPTMEGLLAALLADPTRKRRWLGGLAAVGFSVAGYFGWQHIDREQVIAACSDEAAVIEEHWNEETRAVLEQGLHSTGKSFAGTTFEKAAGHLDAWSDSWREGREEVCRVSEVSEQSDSGGYTLKRRDSARC